MKKISLNTLGLLLIISGLVSCDKEIIMPIQQSVDPELQEYFDIFTHNAIQFGYEDDLNIAYNIIISDDQKTLYVGTSNKGTQTIKIHTSCLVSPKYVEFVMLHECGHYFFGLKHNSSLILSDQFSNDIVNEYFNDRENSLIEFFNSISYNGVSKD
jgi:hypothetical protein